MDYSRVYTKEEIREVIPPWIIDAVVRCEDPSTQAELLAASAWVADRFTVYAALRSLAHYLLPTYNGPDWP